MAAMMGIRCWAPRSSQEFNRQTRREILLLSWGFASAAFVLPSSSWSAAQRKRYTNLQEAREAGEALREERDRAKGPIITLPSGIKFREVDPGSGRTIALGDIVSVQYVIYRLNGLYLDSLGYGNEGKDDVGETLNFEFGAKVVPRAIELGMEGMKIGGKRRILVNPDLGWTDSSLLPHPTTDAAQRRLARSLKGPLLFEVELVKASRTRSLNPQPQEQ